MTKSELATQLRERLAWRIQNDQEFRRQIVHPDLILWHSQQSDDDEIIDSYVTCADCGDKQAEGGELERIIAESHCAADFFDRCNKAAADRGAHALVHWPEEIDPEGPEGRVEVMAVEDINSPGNHEAWIRDYWDDLAAKAYAGYLSEGRGALVFSLPEANDEGFIPGAYVSEGSELHTKLGGWPAKKATEMIATYDPEEELVFMFIGLDFSVDCYLANFVPSPLEAFQSSHLSKHIRRVGDPGLN